MIKQVVGISVDVDINVDWGSNAVVSWPHNYAFKTG